MKNKIKQFSNGLSIHYQSQIIKIYTMTILKLKIRKKSLFNLFTILFFLSVSCAVQAQFSYDISMADVSIGAPSTDADWNKTYNEGSASAVKFTPTGASVSERNSCNNKANGKQNVLTFSSSDSHWLDIEIPSGSNSTILAIMFNVVGNSSGSWTEYLWYSTSSPFDANKAYRFEYTLPGYDKACVDQKFQFPDDVKSVRMYRRVKAKDNGDGTYTTKIYADSLDNLPTKINFTANNNLLTVDKLNTSKVTTMFQMFRSCGNLTAINCRLDTSSVTNEISQIFNGCSKLEYIDATNLVGSNIKYASSLFSNCNLLKQIDGLDTWDISGITDFSNMFANCYALSDLTAVENWDMSNAKILDSMFARCNAIESFNLTKWDVSNVTDMRYMFGWARGPVSIDMTGWDTSNVTNMYYMFGFCNKLTEIKGLENFNTAKVTNMQFMLTDYQGIELDLSGWDVSSVTNMSQLFDNCLNLQSLNLSGWNTSNVTHMNNMFNNCSSLTTITGLSDLDTSSVTTMENMFNNCSGLTSLALSGFDTSNVTNMTAMFKNCSNLTFLDVSGAYIKRSELDDIIRQINVLRSDVDNLLQNNGGEVHYYNPIMSIGNDRAVNGFNTSKVTNMSSMFSGCSKLTSLDVSGFNTSNVAVMNNMFSNCSKLTSLDVSGWDTSSVTTMDAIFYGVLAITSLDLSDWNVQNVTNFKNFFYNQGYALKSLNSMMNISASLDLTPVSNLDQTSLLDVLNNLATVITTQTLKLGSTHLAKLTEDQIAIAVNKGWTVA